MGTAATVPWWYVAALAGTFTVLGASLSVATTWVVARRKNRLDDSRRFDEDIIATYIRLDEICDVLHNNAGGDAQKERATYWSIWRELVRIKSRMALIATPEIVQLTSDITRIVAQMEPSRSRQEGSEGMPELVDSLDELRRVIRKTLRIGPGTRRPLRARVTSAAREARWHLHLLRERSRRSGH